MKNKYDISNYKLFKESARYLVYDEMEKKEAKQYLESWKKFLLRRLSAESFEVILEVEKKQGRQYLESWKKLLLRRLLVESFEVILVDQEWIEREPFMSGILSEYRTISLKLMVKADHAQENTISCAFSP